MAVDGSLIFNTGLDSSGFLKGISGLKTAAAAAAAAVAASFTMAAAAAVNVGTAYTSSMSQVAATMSITAAAEDYAMLSSAAKEMGASTKYSASQAADALNYLALAGYSAQKSVTALPTVLNLAAAGGIDLAYASDMVTDSMSALGLSVDELEGFTDQLAKTSQKSNTSVAQLGEAVLTVGGTAKSLSGGVQELSTMLGILADNGVKGAEGGTALRNVILSLSAPTDTAATAMAKLGVSAYDASGNMRYLPDVFGEFNAALGNLTEQEKTQALSDIFNKVDLKSVNALLGTSAERFDELSGYIADCGGAAAQMAETMSDNLEGDMLAFQSALEGVGIAAFEKFESPMRKAVQSVTSDLSDLNSEISEGKLSDNLDKISESAGNLISKVGEVTADKVLPAVVNGMTLVIDHGNEIVTTLEAIAAALITFKGLTAFNDFQTAVTKVSMKLMVIQAESGKAAVAARVLKGEFGTAGIAASLFSGQINIATAAAKAFQMAANSPILLASILAAVVVAAVKLSKALMEATETTKAAQQAADDYNSAIKRQEQLIQDNNSRFEADKQSLQDKIKIYEELRKEYEKTGKGESELIEITKEIQQLSPVTIDFIDEETQKYVSLAGAVDDVIEAMERKRRYENAESNYNAVQNELDDLYRQQEALVTERNRLMDEYKEKYGYDPDDLTGMTALMVLGPIETWAAGVDKININQNREALDEINDAILDAQSRINEAKSEIKDYYLGDEADDNSAYYDAAQQHRTAAEEYARTVIAADAQVRNEIAAAQAANTEKLEKSWKELDHQYSAGTGAISSEQELYQRKKALLEKYGNQSLEEHWKYYEELYGYEQDFAEDTRRLNEETARQSEQAMKEQLDERKKAAEKTLDTVKSSLSDILSEYESAYSDYESKVKSYKSRLLSVGDIFTYSEKTDENGNVTKTYTINDMEKQLDEMHKFHAYVKKLKAEGAADGLLEELISLDFDQGAQFGSYLSGLSNSEFEKINELYKERDALAEELARDLYRSEAEQLNSTLMSCVDSALEGLPEQAQEIGKRMLESILSGMDIADSDLSEHISSFTEGFSEMYENAIENMDVTDSLNTAFSGVDAYGIGKNLAAELTSGFNEELAKLRADIDAEQIGITAGTSPVTGGGRTASSSAPKEEIIRIDNTNNITVELDGEKVGRSVAKNRNEITRRQGR